MIAPKTMKRAHGANLSLSAHIAKKQSKTATSVAKMRLCSALTPPKKNTFNPIFLLYIMRQSYTNIIVNRQTRGFYYEN
jgi:hypothetical protein